MANTITITATKANTTKTLEYCHPTTGVWQDSNILTNVPAGTYTNILVRLKGSNPAIQAMWAQPITVVDGSTTPAPTVPAAVTQLDVTPGNAQLLVSIEAPATGGAAILSYRYEYRAGTSGAWSVAGTTANLSYTITSLTNGTAYQVRAFATNSVGTSAAGTVVSATPTAASGGIAEPLYVISYGNSQTFGNEWGSWSEQLAALLPAGIVFQSKKGNPGINWAGLQAGLQDQVLSQRDTSKRQIVLLQEFTNSQQSYADQKTAIIDIYTRCKAAGFLVGLQTQYYHRDDDNSSIVAQNQQVRADRAQLCDILCDVNTSQYLSLPLSTLAKTYLFNDNLHFRLAGDTLVARMWLDALQRLKNGTYAGEVVPSTYVLPSYLTPTMNVGQDGDNASTTFNPQSITPTAGPVGTVFAVQGTGLADCNLVSLSGRQIRYPYVQSLSNSRVNICVPQDMPQGNYDIYLITQYGSGTVPNALFTVNGGTVVTPALPTIASFTPTTMAVGDTVTLTGTNLTGTNLVKLGTATVSAFTVNSATQITLTVPTGAVDGATFSVTTAAGTGTAAAGITLTSTPPVTSFTPPGAGLYALFDTKAPNYETNSSSQITRFVDTSGNNRHMLLNGTSYATLTQDAAGNKRAQLGSSSYAFPYYPVGQDFTMVLELEFLPGNGWGPILSIGGYSHMLWDRNDGVLHFYTGAGEIQATTPNDAVLANTDGSPTPLSRRQRRYILDYRASDGRIRIITDGAVNATGTGAGPASANMVFGNSADGLGSASMCVGRFAFYDHIFSQAEIDTWTAAPGL